MAKKTHDLKVKHGTYIKDGEEKNNYKTIGLVMENNDGGKFLMLDPTVNLSAFDCGKDANGKQRTMLMVSMFEVKEESAVGKSDKW